MMRIGSTISILTNRIAGRDLWENPVDSKLGRRFFYHLS